MNDTLSLESLIRKTFNLDASVSVEDDHAPGDLPGWDSLGHVALMSALENQYNVIMDMEEVVSIESVSDIRRILTSKGVQV